MEFKIRIIRTNFLSLKNFNLHLTEVPTCLLAWTQLRGKFYVGLQGKSYYEGKNSATHKSILPPIEAWRNSGTHELPTLEKAVKEQQATERPAPKESAQSRKRLSYNGMLKRLLHSLLIHSYSPF